MPRLFRSTGMIRAVVETKKTIKQALNQCLHQVMAEDDAVICIGEDIAENGGVFGVTDGLHARFGGARVIDTPISETAFVGMGVGAAMTGLKPVVEIMFCDFAGVCFDQILNQAAKARFLSHGRLKLPLVVRTTMGAGDSSAAMHSASLHGLFASIAGLVVVCPSTPYDAAGLLKAAIRSDDPVIFLENKQLYETSFAMGESSPAVRLGAARLVRDGSDLTIVAASAMMHTALAAAEDLESRGISAAVIDPRTIKPFDYETVCAHVSSTGRLLVVDEGAAFAGFSDAVVAGVVERVFGALKLAPRKLTPPDTPVPYAPAAERAWLPNAEDVSRVAIDMMEA